jgi:hypothetical protein
MTASPTPEDIARVFLTASKHCYIPIMKMGWSYYSGCLPEA